MLVWFQNPSLFLLCHPKNISAIRVSAGLQFIPKGTCIGTGFSNWPPLGRGRLEWVVALCGNMFHLLPHLLSSGTLLCVPHKNFWVWDLVQLMRNRFSAGKPIGKEENSLLKPFMSWPMFSFLSIAPADPLFWWLLFLFPLSVSFLVYLCHGSMGEINTDVDSRIRTGQIWFCGICSTWEMKTKGRNNS